MKALNVLRLELGQQFISECRLKVMPPPSNTVFPAPVRDFYVRQKVCVEKLG
jgi:hypothetical protein